MKLELKHLAAYLTHNLQLLFEKSGRIITMMSCFNDGFLHIIDYNEGNDYDLRVWNFKPLLHPLSDLTEEIEVNGKHFTPCYHWDHSNPEQDTYCDRIINVASDPSSVEYLDYFIVEKLLEWHFDIFGLIDAGLAVDINTVKL